MVLTISAFGLHPPGLSLTSLDEWLCALRSTVLLPSLMRRQNMGNGPSRGAIQSQAQQPRRRRPPPRALSWSTPPVPDSCWSSQDFMLGAGMVIFQPSTCKVVIVYDREREYWFLPRGRKDLGESLETTALREAYEEVWFSLRLVLNSE